MGQEVRSVPFPPAESRTIARPRLWPGRVALGRLGSLADVALAVAATCWVAAAAMTLVWPDQNPWYSTVEVGFGTGGIGALIPLAALAGLALPAIGARLRRVGPWLLVLGILAIAWQVTTAKLALLPLPYFPPPQAIVDGFEDDWSLLLESLAYSLRLLALGYAISAAVGFFSGVAGVSRSYYDVARTLGARDRFLIWKVAVPAALPSVFVGLFMGLGTSFVTLLVAEMLGVKAGLGWYIQWAQGWAEYPKMYAALLIMIVVFSSLITLLFRIRNWALSWQKGLVRW